MATEEVRLKAEDMDISQIDDHDFDLDLQPVVEQPAPASDPAREQDDTSNKNRESISWRKWNGQGEAPREQGTSKDRDAARPRNSSKNAVSKVRADDKTRNRKEPLRDDGHAANGVKRKASALGNSRDTKSGPPPKSSRRSPVKVKAEEKLRGRVKPSLPRAERPSSKKASAEKMNPARKSKTAARGKPPARTKASASRKSRPLPPLRAHSPRHLVRPRSRPRSRERSPPRRPPSPRGRLSPRSRARTPPPRGRTPPPPLRIPERHPEAAYRRPSPRGLSPRPRHPEDRYMRPRSRSPGYPHRPPSPYRPEHMSYAHRSPDRQAFLHDPGRSYGQRPPSPHRLLPPHLLLPDRGRMEEPLRPIHPDERHINLISRQPLPADRRLLHEERMYADSRSLRVDERLLHPEDRYAAMDRRPAIVEGPPLDSRLVQSEWRRLKEYEEELQRKELALRQRERETLAAQPLNPPMSAPWGHSESAFAARPGGEPAPWANGGDHRSPQAMHRDAQWQRAGHEGNLPNPPAALHRPLSPPPGRSQPRISTARHLTPERLANRPSTQNGSRANGKPASAAPVRPRASNASDSTKRRTEARPAAASSKPAPQGAPQTKAPLSVKTDPKAVRDRPVSRQDKDRLRTENDRTKTEKDKTRINAEASRQPAQKSSAPTDHRKEEVKKEDKQEKVRAKDNSTQPTPKPSTAKPSTAKPRSSHADADPKHERAKLPARDSLKSAGTRHVESKSNPATSQLPHKPSGSKVPHENLMLAQWHYRDPQGNVQGPASMHQLKLWLTQLANSVDKTRHHVFCQTLVWKTGKSLQDGIPLLQLLNSHK